MSGVLRLRFFQSDLDGLLFLIDIEDIAERLKIGSDHLDLDGSLRDRGDFRRSELVRLGFPGSPNPLTELHFGAAFHEFDDDACPIDWFARRGSHLNPQLCHRSVGSQSERAHQHCQAQEKASHQIIMRYRAEGSA